MKDGNVMGNRIWICKLGIEGDCDCDSSVRCERVVLLQSISRAQIFLRLDFLMEVVSRTFFWVEGAMFIVILPDFASACNAPFFFLSVKVVELACWDGGSTCWLSFRSLYHFPLLVLLPNKVNDAIGGFDGIADSGHQIPTIDTYFRLGDHPHP